MGIGEGWKDADVRMKQWKHGRLYGWKEYGRIWKNMEGCKDRRMEGYERIGRMEEWKDGRMEGWKDGRMEGCQDAMMPGCQDSMEWQDGKMAGWKDRRVE